MDIYLMILLLFIIIFGVGTFYTIQNFILKKKEKGISFILFTSGLSLIFSSFGSPWNDINQLMTTFFVSESASDAIEINSAFSQTRWDQLVTGILLMLAGSYLIYFSRNKIFILNINAYYDKRIESNNRDVGLSTFEFKEREIDLVRIYKKGKIKCSNKEIIEIIGEKTTSFKTESKNFKRGYTGIAPIPFIALAGTYLKREKIDEYFEFDKIHTEKFYKLQKKKKKYSSLQINKNLNEVEVNRDEVVIAVSTTRRITQEQMNQFGNAKKIELYINDPKDNAIQYKPQLFDYAQKVAETIEELSASNCKRIHLLISSQSSLALEIGKKIDDQRMVEITCYFFDVKLDNQYPWGIIMNGGNKGEIIEH